MTCFYAVLALKKEPRALCMLGKNSTTESYRQPVKSIRREEKETLEGGVEGPCPGQG